MPDWQDRPPAPNEFAGVRIVRVPPNKIWDGIITCDKLTGCPTHFHHRRTVPCEGDDCPVCRDGVPAKWHGYVSYYSQGTFRHVVLELTNLAAIPLIDFYDRHGSLRGARLQVQRIGHATNSPVECRVLPADTDLRTLPQSINIKAFLATIWKLDTTEPVPETPHAHTLAQLERRKLLDEIGQSGQADPPRRQNIRNTNTGNHPENTPETTQPPAGSNGKK